MNDKKITLLQKVWGLWYPQRHDLLLVPGFCLLLIIFDQCTVKPHSQVINTQDLTSTVTTASFTLPEIPAVLTSAQERAEYLVVHYWDNFNFANTTLISNAEITEQAFVDYINLFPKNHIKCCRTKHLCNVRQSLRG